MKSTSYKLLIYDEQYSIISDESAARVAQAASLVDALMKEIATKVPHIDEKRIAVLVALQFASKVLQLESTISDSSNRHQQLIDIIDREWVALAKNS